MTSTYTGVSSIPGRAQKAARARYAVSKAIRMGELTRGPCAMQPRGRTCEGVIEAHHESYDLPLAVIWLCRPHHQGLHADRRNAIFALRQEERNRA
jgi:hypothetical protein